MLKGIRVVDFSHYIPGPYASLRLAELGAEVIKIEPLTGDLARGTGEDGTVFQAHNRQKKSVALDLKNESDKMKAIEIIKEADVMIESFRPGVMNRLGLGYEDIKIVHPGIVYCAVTGYGDKGPLSHMGSHDINYLSLSGVLAQLKDDHGKPIHPTHTLADYFGGLAASERILAALLAKVKTGEGSYHCVSITEAVASTMANHVMYDQVFSYKQGIPVLSGSIVSYGLYETKDKRYISLAALEEKFWRNFCQAVDRMEWLSYHHSKAVDTNRTYLEMKALIKRRTISEWTEFGMSVDCCLTPVLEVDEVRYHPYFVHNKQVYDSVWGEMQVSM
ncbi:CaiB/BaiF CoA transferase family protein, partial [Peribacillus acanthi]|uniref:CaiB/BaiF CoA transferase family protein n=1 Tax=Peribacillus acanthi TaxID=2171554 RepID=UPI001F0B7C32